MQEVFDDTSSVSRCWFWIIKSNFFSPLNFSVGCVLCHVNPTFVRRRSSNRGIEKRLINFFFFSGE